MAKKSSKKQAKEAATAATPPTDEAKAAEAAAAEEKAKAEAEAKAAAEKQAKEAAEAAKTVQVIVGPNGAAGRIVVGKTTYDGVTPRPMAKADYQRLRAQYDLREAKDS